MLTKVEEKSIVKSSQFMLMEAADNAQILAEINGEMLKAMVYRFKGKDRLSYAGAKFAAIQLGTIHVKESTVIYNKELDQFEASALALNENINLTLPGYAEQPRLMKVWDNREKTESHLELDEFARRKAASKAVRNALMAVMPADHIAAYMRAAIDKGNVKTIKNVESVQTPPENSRAESDRVKAIREQAKRDRENRTEPPSYDEGPQTGVSSIEELEEIIERQVVGVDELISVTQDMRGFTIEPNRTLDLEIIEVISYIVEGLGGKHREHQTGVGYSWVVPYKNLE